MKPFRIDHHEEVTDCGTTTIPIQAHKALDGIIQHMETQDLGGGGEVVLIEPTGKSYRLTFCEFTNLNRCPHCQGTGAQRNNTN